jgi:hypothetical protein
MGYGVDWGMCCILNVTSVVLTITQGVLTMNAFQHSFNLDPYSSDFANLQGNIVSVLQAGCFFGALASFYVSDTFGRKRAIIIADVIFLVGSLVQTLIYGGNLPQLYVGRVIGGFGVGLISAVVPTYIGENAPKQIRGRCIGCMVSAAILNICHVLTNTATFQCNWHLSGVLRQLRHQPRHHRPDKRSQMAHPLCPSNASWGLLTRWDVLLERESSLACGEEPHHGRCQSTIAGSR